MVLSAWYEDIPQLREMMKQLKPQTAWAQVQGDYSDTTLDTFLGSRLNDPRSMCKVFKDRGRITGFAGVALSQFYLPPYMPLVFEWGMGGDKRAAVKCYRACCEWAKSKGAEWAGRVSASPGDRSDRVLEPIVWSKL